MLNLKENYFTKREALQDIKEVLENGYDSYLCDLHHNVFNTAHYIVGACDAKKALNEHGVFEAIEKVNHYEQLSFGESLTDISSPEKLASMLYYIIGEEVLNELIENNQLDDYFNDKLTEVSANQLIRAIEKELVIEAIKENK